MVSAPLQERHKPLEYELLDFNLSWSLKVNYNYGTLELPMYNLVLVFNSNVCPS